MRLAGAVSDLHAADVRYHDDFRKKFIGKRNVESSSKESVEQVDHAFDATVSEIKSDRLRIWSSVEVFSTYTGNDGSLLSRGSLVQRLNEFFAGELIVLSSPGLANILLFRSTASNVLRVVDFEEDDKSPEVVAKQIVRECKELCIDKNVYNTRIDKDLAKEETSSTLLTLLSNVSEKLDNNLPALLIGNIVTSMLTNKPTSLQIALGVQVRQKNSIESSHDFGVTCSYDEMLRFKASAASAAAGDVNSNLRAITDSKEG